MIRKYSSSYINSKDNFAIIYNEESNNLEQFISTELYGVFCVVQNIIQRGNPSNPSKYIAEKIGYASDLADQAKACYWISKKTSNWSKTIKGAVASSDYPALIFFNNILPEHLGEYAFARNLIIAEAEFDDVVGEKTGFSGQQVDFYLPVLSLVIEIDGTSHSEKGQRKKDRERDEELIRHHIRTLRITAHDIKNRTDRLDQQMSWLKQQLIESESVNNYRQWLNNRIDGKKVALETVMRLQMLLLLCLKENKIDLHQSKWKIHFSHTEVNQIERLLLIAYEDLKKWFTSITTLLKSTLEYPEIEIVDDKNLADIIIDYGLLSRYDDTCNPSRREYIIRTDYFRGRDYYQVAVSDTLEYKLDLDESSKDMEQLKYLLANIFEYNEFRDGQLPSIANVLEGNDTIGILPTGGGKSLCYQFAALLQPGVTIIVEPIISLMRDQRKSMQKKHIDHNQMLSSMQSGTEKGSLLTDFQNGKYQMIWVSPERFQNIEFRESLEEINRKLNFCIAVIDEVHCLSEWGHDFRVSYLALVRTIREYCPAAILLGLTATASEFVLTDIRVEFGGEDGILGYSHVKTMPTIDRPKLRFIRIPIRSSNERNEVIKGILRSENNSGNFEPGLIFCPTIKGKETGCIALSNLLSADFCGQYRLFHGQMSQNEKATNQDDFMDGAFPIMICTKAFGMGIDKENIRYTIHDTLPQSIEAFYQEAGRAGRDDDYANCYIVYNVDNNYRQTIKKLDDENKLLVLLDDEYGKTFNNCDLSTPLYFLNSNHMKEKDERQYVASVLYYLQGNNTIPFQQANYATADFKQTLESALYKLSLIGFVNSWTVQYQSLYSGTLTVDCVDINQLAGDYALNNFIAYVQKYEADFSLNSDRGLEYKNIYDQNEKKISNVIQMLIRWTNQNILYQRLKCISNMAQWCSPDVDDSTFRNRLNGYFRFDDKTILLEHVAHNPQKTEEWLGCFYVWNEEKTRITNIINESVAKDIYASLQRFLESYRNNAGLNFLDGLLRLFCFPNMSRNALGRFESSLKIIQGMPEAEQKKLIDESLRIGRHIDYIENKDLLSQVLIDYYPNEIRNVFNILHDRYSLSLELETVTERLEKIKWII